MIREVGENVSSNNAPFSRREAREKQTIATEKERETSRRIRN